MLHQVILLLASGKYLHEMMKESSEIKTQTVIIIMAALFGVLVDVPLQVASLCVHTFIESIT